MSGAIYQLTSRDGLTIFSPCHRAVRRDGYVCSAFGSDHFISGEEVRRGLWLAKRLGEPDA